MIKNLILAAIAVGLLVVAFVAVMDVIKEENLEAQAAHEIQINKVTEEADAKTGGEAPKQ